MRFKKYDTTERGIRLIKVSETIVPNGTDELVHIEDIRIPQNFALTQPLQYKMNRCDRLYKKLGYIDKPISVIVETNEKGLPNKFLLVDQYSRYLYAKNTLKAKYVPVKYIEFNM